MSDIIVGLIIIVILGLAALPLIKHKKKTGSSYSCYACSVKEEHKSCCKSKMNQEKLKSSILVKKIENN